MANVIDYVANRNRGQAVRGGKKAASALNKNQAEKATVEPTKGGGGECCETKTPEEAKE